MSSPKHDLFKSYFTCGQSAREIKEEEKDTEKKRMSFQSPKRSFFARILTLAVALFLTGTQVSSWSQKGGSCYELFHSLTRLTLSGQGKPVVLHADGTKVALSYAMEKEGLMYSDIAEWFDKVDPSIFEAKVRRRMQQERSGERHPLLLNFLKDWAKSFKAPEIQRSVIPVEWYRGKGVGPVQLGVAGEFLKGPDGKTYYVEPRALLNRNVHEGKENKLIVREVQGTEVVRGRNSKRRVAQEAKELHLGLPQIKEVGFFLEGNKSGKSSKMEKLVSLHASGLALRIKVPEQFKEFAQKIEGLPKEGDVVVLEHRPAFVMQVEPKSGKAIVQWINKSGALGIVENVKIKPGSASRITEVQFTAVQKRKSAPSRKIASRDHIADEVLDYILDFDNPFDAISIEGREKLLYDGILSFDDLKAKSTAPDFFGVQNDQGSYELASKGGTQDRRDFLRQRDILEDSMEGSIGHQHILHAWPKDAAKRKEMSGRYIELMDATSWFLFWRQMGRHREDFDSGILAHRFLGVHDRNGLERLRDAVERGDAKGFKNKYRTIGARAFEGNPLFEGQEGQVLPDWELRSGNKSARYRRFVENSIMARLASGDYKGLRDFRDYDFDASKSLRDLVQNLIPEKDKPVLDTFETTFSMLRWSDHPLARNHFRNKIVSPLLLWENRLNFGANLENFLEARAEYANELVNIAKSHQRSLRLLTAYAEGAGKQETSTVKKGELNNKTLQKIDDAIIKFTDAVRLDHEFFHYLMPKPETVPTLTVKPTGPFDVNNVDLGIEYSFRFAKRPENVREADAMILSAAEAFKAKMGGGTIEKRTAGGHGHGLSVRYKYTDPQGRDWRFEWDGVKRSYREGSPYWARAGHVEVPTPKFSPKTPEDIVALYEIMRSVNFYPKRLAGGGHVNIDTSLLKAMPPEQGARKMANLILLHERTREMTNFLWQHPARTRVAIKPDYAPDFLYQLERFQGDWNALGQLLFDKGYFNPYIGRKPNYTELNVSGLMAEMVDQKQRSDIDIKNEKKKWRPAFTKSSERIEFRLFDAPFDEHIAALQIKYTRALLDKAWSNDGTLVIGKIYTDHSHQAWRENPDLFYRDFDQHMQMLGLDPKEFDPLVSDVFEIQSYKTKIKRPPPTKPKYIKRNIRVPPEEEAEGPELD